MIIKEEMNLLRMRKCGQAVASAMKILPGMPPAPLEWLGEGPGPIPDSSFLEVHTGKQQAMAQARGFLLS